MFTDPISDMIARIRNALMRQKKVVDVPNSRQKRAILDVLVREGYVIGYTQEDRIIKVELKYYHGQSVIQDIRSVSKPSLSIYTSVRKMPSVANGLGNAVVTTSRGVLSDREAKEMGVGGKLLLTVR